jgi:hypothetical protein
MNIIFLQTDFDLKIALMFQLNFYFCNSSDELQI